MGKLRRMFKPWEKDRKKKKPRGEGADDDDDGSSSSSSESGLGGDYSYDPYMEDDFYNLWDSLGNSTARMSQMDRTSLIATFKRSSLFFDEQIARKSLGAAGLKMSLTSHEEGEEEEEEQASKTSKSSKRGRKPPTATSSMPVQKRRPRSSSPIRGGRRSNSLLSDTNLQDLKEEKETKKTKKKKKKKKEKNVLNHEESVSSISSEGNDEDDESMKKTKKKDKTKNEKAQMESLNKKAADPRKQAMLALQRKSFSSLRDLQDKQHVAPVALVDQLRKTTPASAKKGPPRHNSLEKKFLSTGAIGSNKKKETTTTKSESSSPRPSKRRNSFTSSRDLDAAPMLPPQKLVAQVAKKAAEIKKAKKKKSSDSKKSKSSDDVSHDGSKKSYKSSKSHKSVKSHKSTKSHKSSKSEKSSKSKTSKTSKKSKSSSKEKKLPQLVAIPSERFYIDPAIRDSMSVGDKYIQTNANLAEMKVEKERLQKDLERTKNELSELQAMLTASAKENYDLVNQLNTSKEEMHGAQTMIEGLRTRTSALEYEKSELATRLYRSEQEVRDLTAQVKHMENHTSVATDKSLWTELIDLRKTVNQKQKEVDDKVVELKEKDSEIQSLQQKLADGSGVSGTKQTLELEAELEHVKNQHKKQAMEDSLKLASQGAMLTEQEKELRETRAKNSKYSQELQDTKEELEVTSERLRIAIDEIEEAQGLRAKVENLQARVDEADNVEQGLLGAIDKWTDKAFEWKTKVEMLEKELASVRGRNELLEDERNKIMEAKKTKKMFPR